MKPFFLVFLIAFTSIVSAQNNIQYVNVFIGTDGTGHTFPGPSMPFGMVQPGPDNRDQGWNHTSGYQYQDSIILGFSQARFSGTGINEMGDVLLLPFAKNPNEILKNRYYKDSEKARVGYYSLLKKDGVKVELSCSERAAIHRYTFPTEEASVLANLQHGLRFLTDSLVLESEVQIEDHQTISGYCHTKNWVERKYFFVIKFDKPFIKYEQLEKGPKENAPKNILTFNLGKNKILLAKISLSTVDVAGAKLNMQTEVPGWDFEKVKQNAENTWNQYLGRIEIKAKTKQKEIFYTSLYHLFLQPSNIADVDGKYRGADDQIALAPNKEYYSTLSIWDVYRGAFPLLQIIAPEKINGIINSMLLHHKAAGFLPIWTAWGQDNYCMIGNHAIPMILSAYNKGFTGFDKNEALKAMVETSTISHIVYLYAYSNTPKIGQKYIHRIINEFHNNTPGGMIGNDDCGQMSAWYILSCLGFYPVNPAGNEFVFGSPQLEKAILHLPDGKQLAIESRDFSETSLYNDIRILNGIQIKKAFITYQEIMDGGNLKFMMTKD